MCVVGVTLQVKTLIFRWSWDPPLVPGIQLQTRSPNIREWFLLLRIRTVPLAFTKLNNIEMELRSSYRLLSIWKNKWIIILVMLGSRMFSMKKRDMQTQDWRGRVKTFQSRIKLMICFIPSKNYTSVYSLKRSRNIWESTQFSGSKYFYQFSLYPKISKNILDSVICQRIDADSISVSY